MPITSHLLCQTKKLLPLPEVTNPLYQMFNTGGVEIEVAEFLFSLVRMLKPDNILETGTHLGISSSYMAAACKENKKGKVITFEVIPELLQQALPLWKDLNVGKHIEAYLLPSLAYKPVPELQFDILFLDSEPQYRFDEFLRFWENLKPGGFIVIHDLDHVLGHHGETHHGVFDWPYGDFRQKLGPYLKEHKVQAVYFPTPRGLTIFQKEGDRFEGVKYIREESNS